MKRLIDIPNIPGYRVSRNGDIFTSDGTLVKPITIRGTYKCVSLWTIYGTQRLMVHRIVAATFIPTDNIKLQVNHKDGNKFNNNVNNLEWVTPSENIRHAHRTGLIRVRRGEETSSAKLRNEDVNYIRANKKTKTARELGLAFNIHPSHIRRIWKGLAWNHI